MTQKAVDRLEGVRRWSAGSYGSGPPAGPERAADQAPGGPIPGRRPLGTGLTPPRSTPRQHPVRRRSPGGAGTGPHPLSRLRPHAGLRKAGRPPRAQALCRDAAPVDDRRGALEAQARIHQRRPCRGELVQIDGSPHD